MQGMLKVAGSVHAVEVLRLTAEGERACVAKELAVTQPQILPLTKFEKLIC